MDTHDQIFDAMHSFVKLTLLFYDPNWTDEKQQKWESLQVSIKELDKAAEYVIPQPPTTKGLGNLARIILG